MTIVKDLIILSMSITLLSCGENNDGDLNDDPIVEEGKPAVPRIDFVEMVNQQPHENDENTIWYDDFLTDKNSSLGKISFKPNLCAYFK